MPEVAAARLQPTKAILLGRAGLSGVTRSGGKVTIGAATPVAELCRTATSRSRPRPGTSPTSRSAPRRPSAATSARPRRRGSARRSPGAAARPRRDACARPARAARRPSRSRTSSPTARAGSCSTSPTTSAAPRPAYAAVRRPARPPLHDSRGRGGEANGGELRVAATGCRAARRAAARRRCRDGARRATRSKMSSSRDDALASAWYRPQLLPRLVERALADLEEAR